MIAHSFVSIALSLSAVFIHSDDASIVIALPLSQSPQKHFFAAATPNHKKQASLDGDSGWAALKALSARNVSKPKFPYVLSQRKLYTCTKDHFAEWIAYSKWTIDDVYRQYKLYKYNGFRDYLRTHSDHETRINALYQEKLRTHDCGFWEFWGHATGSYHFGLKTILAAEIASINQYKKSEAHRAQILHDRVQKQERIRCATQKYVAQNRDALQVLATQWHNAPSPRLHNRAQALEKVLNGDDTFSDVVCRNRDASVNAFLQTHGINRDLIYNGYSNAIQRVLHQELYAIAVESAQKQKTSQQSSQHPLFSIILDALVLGLHANKAGIIEAASACADICWHILDGIQAVGEGMHEAIERAVHACVHPVEAVIHLGSNIISGLSTVVKGLYYTELLHYYHKYEPEKYAQYRQEAHDYIAATAASVKQSLQDTRPRNRLKKSAELVTEGILLHYANLFVHEASTALLNGIKVLNETSLASAHVTEVALAGLPEQLIADAFLTEKITQAFEISAQRMTQSAATTEVVSSEMVAAEEVAAITTNVVTEAVSLEKQLVNASLQSCTIDIIIPT